MNQILEYIRSDSSKNFKVNAIKQHADNELFKGLLQRTYSPLVRFGISIAQIPGYEFSGNCMGLEQALVEIDRLSSREYTGNAAKAHIAKVLSNLSPENAKIIEQVIDGSLKIQCNASTINKALGRGFIKDAPYMGAVSFDQKRVDKLFSKESRLVSQLKMDGRFCNSAIEGGKVSMESRQGLPTYFGSTFDSLAVMESLYGEPLVLNGEMVVSGYERDRYTGNAVVSSLVSIGDKIMLGEDVEKDKVKFQKRWGQPYEVMLLRLKLVVWDFIPMHIYSSADKWEKPYGERLQELEAMIDQAGLKNLELVETRFVESEAEARTHFLQQLELDNEGTILKSLESGWQDGKPVFNVKMKVELTFDLEITGGNMGKAGTKNENVISSLNTKTACGELKTSPGGMPEEMMAHVTENLDSLIGTIVTIKCNGLSRDKHGNWSVLHPAVIELRDDKSEADSLNDCINIQDMKKSLTENVMTPSKSTSQSLGQNDLFA